jgi:hypothetical protein
MNVLQLNESFAKKNRRDSLRRKTTFYDALPVPIAENKKTACVTADEETQYKKLKPKGHTIELL